MELFPIDLPPGVARGATQFQTKGRWWDANLIRWTEGIMRPIGGWSRFTTSALTGKCRRLYVWKTNGGGRYLAAGTSSKLYVTRTDGTVYDITPVGFTAGSDDATETLGYGGGGYGLGTYGTARSGGTLTPPMTWTMDNWGEYLVACALGDGDLYEWQINTSNPAAIITNAPLNNRAVLVSEQRHLIALGAGGNPRKVQWSGKEANTVWTPSSTNEAGSFELQTQGVIINGVRTRGQTLILTDVDAHVMNYIGQPYIFSRDRVGLDCGLIAPGAITVTGLSAPVWMGTKKFWIFDGGAVRPLPCEVGDYVFGHLNLTQKEKIVAGHNGQLGEVWFFYPSTGNTEPNRYVVWNYREDHWTIGALSRTSWVDSGAFSNPIAADTSNHLYRHEEGYLDNGAARYSSIYADSGAIDFDNGNRVIDIHQVIPDEHTQGEVNVSFTTRFTPTGTAYSYGPYTVRTDGYTDTRLSGRQIVMRIAPTLDDDFRVGVLRAGATVGAQR